MPSFNFNFKVVRKPAEKRIKSTYNNGYKRLSLVVNTTEEGLFFVTYNDVDYEISLDSYNCAHSHEIYVINQSKHEIIRYSNPSRVIGNAKNYIRFTPGNTVKGYISKNPNSLKEEFHVEHVLTDIPVDIEIRKKFRSNFEQIVEYLDVKLKVIRQSQFI